MDPVKKTLKEDILELLIHQEMTSKEVFAVLQNEGYKITIQAVYKQINILIDEEVVLKNKQNYIVSNEWRRKIASLFSIGGFSLPKIGEKFTYKFTSLTHLDAYWKHITDAVLDAHPRLAAYSYCPHQIWPYVPSRMESEKNMVSKHEEYSRYNYFILGGNTKLDKKYRRIFNQKYFKVELLPKAENKRHIHITVIGDIIIFSHIDKKIAEKIDIIYSSDIPAKDQVSQLSLLLKEDQISKIVIENNPKKADIYKKRYSQPFAII